MMKKLFLVIYISCACFLSVRAQSDSSISTERSYFNHFDLSVSLGTSGVGFDVASPIGRSVTVRTGFQFMPKFKPKMSFGLGLEEGEGPVTPGKFQEITQLFSDFTGCQIDDKVDVIGEPTMNTFSFLVDISPFKDKRWHFTTGIYAGPSRIAKAYNTTEDMPTLFSVLLYNKMYQSYYDDVPLFQYGDNVFWVDPELGEKMMQYGRMAMNIGEFKDGSGTYYMEPNAESMVKVDMKVSKVRPYLGFGFSQPFTNRSDKYSFSFDAGVMFWGGTPEIVTHDGVDLAKDVVNVRGKVGDYVRFMKSFKVCPMLNFKLTRRLF